LVQTVFIETMCSDLDPGPYLKCQGYTRHLKVSVHMVCVGALTFLCIDRLQGPYNLVQMLFLLRRCAVILTRVHTLTVKVTQYM